MRLPEQRLWDRIRSNLIKLDSRLYLERIENVVSEGTADVLAAYDGKVTFLELKAILELPARASTPLLGDKKGLRVEQRNWHLEMTSKGCSTLVVVGVGSRDIFAVRGEHADNVNKWTNLDFRYNACARTYNALLDELKRK